MMELIRKTSIDFMGIRRYAFAFSAALFALGVVGTVQIFRGHANLGIDIAGGTSIQVKFRNAVHLDRIREIMGAAGYDWALIDLEHGAIGLDPGRRRLVSRGIGRVFLLDQFEIGPAQQCARVPLIIHFHEPGSIRPTLFLRGHSGLHLSHPAFDHAAGPPIERSRISASSLGTAGDPAGSLGGLLGGPQDREGAMMEGQMNSGDAVLLRVENLVRPSFR